MGGGFSGKIERPVIASDENVKRTGVQLRSIEPGVVTAGAAVATMQLRIPAQNIFLEDGALSMMEALSIMELDAAADEANVIAHGSLASTFGTSGPNVPARNASSTNKAVIRVRRLIRMFEL